MNMAMGLPDLRPCIYYQDDEGAGDYFAAVAPEIEAFPQRGSDLGERMALAFDDRLHLGCERIAIIGSDSPDLPGDYILRAYDLLDKGKDVVFGPAEDGGYYLLAMGRLRRELFTDLPWSKPELLQASLERAGQMGLEAALLPQWYDLDTCADLLGAMGRGGVQAAPLTNAFLEENCVLANLSDEVR